MPNTTLATNLLTGVIDSVQRNNLLTGVIDSVQRNDLLTGVIDSVQRNDPSVDTLNLRYCEFGDKEMMSLAAAVAKNTVVTSIALEDNDIGAVGAKALATALLHNTTLVNLNLCGNDIGDDGLEALCGALRGNCTLTSLDLSRNGISATGIASLMGALQHNFNLTSINVKDNEADSNLNTIEECLKRNVSLPVSTRTELTLQARGHSGEHTNAGRLKYSSDIITDLSNTREGAGEGGDNGGGVEVDRERGPPTVNTDPNLLDKSSYTRIRLGIEKQNAKEIEGEKETGLMETELKETELKETGKSRQEEAMNKAVRETAVSGSTSARSYTTTTGKKSQSHVIRSNAHQLQQKSLNSGFSPTFSPAVLTRLTQPLSRLQSAKSLRIEEKLEKKHFPFFLQQEFNPNRPANEFHSDAFSRSQGPSQPNVDLSSWPVPDKCFYEKIYSKSSVRAKLREAVHEAARQKSPPKPRLPDFEGFITLRKTKADSYQNAERQQKKPGRKPVREVNYFRPLFGLPICTHIYSKILNP